MAPRRKKLRSQSRRGARCLADFDLLIFYFAVPFKGGFSLMRQKHPKSQGWSQKISKNSGHKTCLTKSSQPQQSTKLLVVQRPLNSLQHWVRNQIVYKRSMVECSRLNCMTGWRSCAWLLNPPTPTCGLIPGDTLTFTTLHPFHITFTARIRA